MNSLLNISPAKEEDIENIYKLIHRYFRQKVVLERSREDISSHLRHFFVARINLEDGKKKIVGCSAFYIYSQELVEIRSLCVDPQHQREGVGSGLVQHQIELAKKSHFKKLFTLTLKENFFEKMGFTLIQKEELPAKIFKDCLLCQQQKNCFEKALIYFP